MSSHSSLIPRPLLSQPFVCLPCLRRLHRLPPPCYVPRRRESSTTTSSQPIHKQSLPTLHAPSHTRLLNRRLIRLSGRDSAHFLQGLTTVNITSSLQSKGGAGFYSAFLNAAGRVLHDVFIYPTVGVRPWRDYGNEKGSNQESEDEGFLIEVDAGEVDALAKYLQRFKLRAKVVIRTIKEDEWGVWATWGHDAASVFNSNDAATTTNADEIRELIQCLDTRAPGMGQRLILPQQQSSKAPPDKFQSYLSGTASSLETYKLKRYLLGVPEGQSEIHKETALPQESNIDYMGGIDFRKGCYVGQELTIRTHHTGVVRKRILPVQLYHHNDNNDIDTPNEDNPIYDPTPPPFLIPPSTDITRLSSTTTSPSRKTRSTGRLITHVGNIGLALCRLEIMTNTALTGEGTQWKEGDDFGIALDNDPDGSEQGRRTVKVRAFVPEWLRERARVLGVRE